MTNRISKMSLGALVLTPTRELAYQIFEVLRNVGCNHKFSAALVIGGKDLKFETERMGEMNILICTPGRLLHHMDENVHLDCSNLRMLIIDEADKILEMGFKDAVDGIIANLPPDRQTLLFSATQTRKVEDLSRLALKDPEYISAHESLPNATPDRLTEQIYSVVEIGDKLDVLHSFIRNHLKCKILVFLSTCKQVKFVHESFTKMQCGVPLLCLHGGKHQLKRMEVYDKFCSKEFVVLFATDIASRGLDFPEVDWVVQVDCPEDVKTYIHRVGRTGRFGAEKSGRAFLMLHPHEQLPFVNQLKEAKVPIIQSDLDQNMIHRKTRTEHKLRSFNAECVELHETAKRAFVVYCKFVYLCKNKDVFDIQKLDLEGFARSLGLITVPRLRFLQNLNINVNGTGRSLIGNEQSHEKLEDNEVSLQAALKSIDDIDDPLIKKENKAKPSRTVFEDEDPESLNFDEKSAKTKPLTAAKKAKILKRKNIKVHQHIKYESDDDEQVSADTGLGEAESNLETSEGINIDALREKMKSRNTSDKLKKRQIVKEKIREKEQKEKGEEDGKELGVNQFRFDFRKNSESSDQEDKDEETSVSTKKRKIAAKSEPKSDLFDYESLAKQENLLLQLMDN